MSRYVLGADNGKSGFVVLLDVDTKEIKFVDRCIEDTDKMNDVLDSHNIVYAATEQPFMASGFSHVSSTNFEILGRYKYAFEQYGIDYTVVRPATWRKKLNIKAKGRDAQKAASIEKASELFSKEDFEALHTEFGRIDKELHKRVKELLPDDNKCESALIAYYALQIWEEQQ